MSRSIQDQVNRTYFSLRWAAAIIGLLFPLIIVVGGHFNNLTRRDSLSAYYHAFDHRTASNPLGTSSLSPKADPCKPNPSGVPDPIPEPGTMRNEFVGLLFAIGVVLYVNKGHTDKENILLNIAGAFAWGIALFPMPWECRPSGPITPHGAFATLFFIAIASILIFCSKDTINCLPEKRRPYYFRLYYFLAGVMLASPLLAIIINDFDYVHKSKLLYLETFGIWAFSAYWVVRTKEIKEVQRHQAVVKATKRAEALSSSPHEDPAHQEFY